MQLLIQSEKIKKAKLHSKKSLKSISSNRKNKPKKMPKIKTPIMLNHLKTTQIRITLLIITVVAITIQIILSLNNPTTTPSSGEYVWPCPGFYYLISTFDENRGSSNHGALDIAGGGIYGAQVIAAREGTVVSSISGCTHDYGKSSSGGCGGGYGNYVVIEHSDGKTILYGQL